MPTPGILVKYINIGAQGLGSYFRAGQIRHSIAIIEGIWESKRYCTGANKVIVTEVGATTCYTLLRITVSIIKV